METKNWKYFRLDNLFEIYTSKDSNLLDSGEGRTPYISSTRENNGISAFIDSEPTHAKNTITIARNGSVGSTFFHSYSYCASPDDVRILKPKFIINHFLGLFLASLIEKERYRYAYGRKFGTGRMKETQIKLPVTPAGTPDWNWIESYMKNEVIKKLPLTVQELFSGIYTPQSLIQKKLTLNIEKWKIFLMKDIFSIKLGRPIHANEIEEFSKSGFPYITRTAENNGVESYIHEEYIENLNGGGAITVGAEGFTAFYQETDFYNGNKVSIIRHSELNNKYKTLFLCTLLDKEIRGRFSYGRGAVKGKLETMKIKLPVTGSGSPDWQFMEDYIKGLPYSASL